MRKPGDVFNWNRHDRTFREPIKFTHRPELHGAPNPVYKSRRIIWQRVMKNDCAFRAAALRNPNCYSRANWKSALRPSERGVLQQNPVATPVVRLAPGPCESTEPSFWGPRNALDFHRLALLFERALQPIAIIFERVGGRVCLTEEIG